MDLTFSSQDRAAAKAALVRAAEQCGGWTALARRLGITRQGLRRYAISGPLGSDYAAAIHAMDDIGVTYWDLLPHLARVVRRDGCECNRSEQ